MANKLPKGVVQNSSGLYRKQIMAEGKRYVFSDRDLKRLLKTVEDKKYEIRHGLYESEKQYNLDKWFEIWLKEYKTNLKKGTKVTYQQAYNDMILASLGKKKIKDIKADMIQSLLNSLQKDGYSYGRVTLAYILLNGLFKKAKALKYININPMGEGCVTMPNKNNTIKKSTKRGKITKALTKEQKEIFLNKADGSVYIGCYIFMFNTGCRLGEALGLRWSDVDFKAREIHISSTLMYLRGTGRVLDSPKSESSARTIPMTVVLYDLLKSERTKQLTNRIAMGKLWKEEKGLEDIVFTYPQGGALWDDGVRKDILAIEKKIRESGVEFPHITPHSFRHTFATLGLKAGVRPKVMQKILGHASLAITMDTYAHVLQDDLREEMNIIAAAT